jgi:glucose-6-phosphate isomerase
VQLPGGACALYAPGMLTLEYANCLADRVGNHGVDLADLAPGSEGVGAVRANTQKLSASRGTGWERWRLLPFDPVRKQHVEAVEAVAARCRGRFENLVVLGIGGSALGNIALQGALNPASYNLLAQGERGGPRMFVVDNVDPAYFGSVLRLCEQSAHGLKGTLFNVISKSGETAETAAQFMVVRDLLKKAIGAGYKENIVAVTDPASGTMRKICDQEGFATLPVPEGVGGRFSVLSPVGLFSATMAGIDIHGLLDGAASMDGPCSRPSLESNPAALLAFILVELGRAKGKPNHVMMPYCNALYLLADWYRQLWAESLGKQVDLTGETVYAGFTPIKALGTTDQHSQIQLYREGPNDKVIGFLEVEGFGDADVTIPTGLGVEAIRYLEGKSMAGLLNAEKRATEYALLESQRPNYTIRFPRLDAFHVGQFIYLWEMVTAYAGLMLNVDAYNQPAVETGKVATFGLMGREGYEKHRSAVDRALAPSRWVIAS